MKQTLPKISVIIPTKDGTDIKEAILALKEVDYPEELYEVILALGKSPSKQRNEAARKAKGEILYFLDNDSEISPQAFRRTLAAFNGQKIGGPPSGTRGFSILPKFICHFIEKKFFSGSKMKGVVVAVGGPSIWNRPESFWSSVGGIVFESFFADLNMCSRFRPIGTMRPTGERELVLCNLAVKRKTFLKLGGFREELYPNEENEFVNRLSSNGFDCLYHPGIYVHKPHRETWQDIVKTFFRYGRGRMEHTRVAGLRPDSPLIPPVILLTYLLALTVYHPLPALLPLFGYLGLGFSSAIGFAHRRKKFYLGFFLPFFFLLVHLSYAIGILVGLFTNLKQKRAVKRGSIRLQILKSFGSAWTN